MKRPYSVAMAVPTYYDRPFKRPYKRRYKKKYRKSNRNYRTGGLVGVEYKYFDVARTILIPTSTDATGLELDPIAGALSVPAQGDGANQRDGRKIKILSIYINGVITGESDQNVQGSIFPGNCFLSLVLDKQTNSEQCQSEQVYVNNVGTTRGTLALQRNMSNTSRFKVLKHKTFDLPFRQKVDTDSRDGCQRQFKIKYKFKKPLVVTFNVGDTTSDVASVADNSLHLFGGCSQSTNMQTTLTYSSRIRFVG